MALTSFFLVVFHHEREEVVRAGWVYLVATHLGTAFLLLLFGLLARDAGSLDFARWARPEHGASWLFAFALVGFGSKAGLFPFHVWLPQAHPVAPSHVSALLSGVMVKMGIYGLLRTLAILGAPAPAWGSALLALGLASAGFGALLLLAQSDLKRALAYSTVENVGIVAIGLGLGLTGWAAGAPAVAALGLAGALLHVWNHALFKSVLFLAAGSLGRAAGTLDLERLGGQLRRMPWTGGAFLAGAAAACALPPLNGFVGEFLIYAGSLQALRAGDPGAAVALASLAGLALAGALAAAGFVRAAGIAFLGEPRSEAAAASAELGSALRAPLLALVAGCLLLGLGAPLALAALRRPLEELLGPTHGVAGALAPLAAVLWRVAAVGAGAAATALALALVRARLLRSRSVRAAGTWDCGYAAPTPRMQYGAASFAEPLTRLFAPIVRLRTRADPPRGPLPGPASFATRTSDAADDAFGGLFAAVAALALRLRPLQAGSTHVYVLYTALAVLALLAWRLA
jgi:formate hydrogenlyase subunit 3/multisubunit Na+/H+ antiporter MnhD subunit